jgi:hypothetical protein
MTGMHHYAQCFSVEMVSQNLSLLGWLQHEILLTSALK